LTPLLLRVTGLQDTCGGGMWCQWSTAMCCVGQHGTCQSRAGVGAHRGFLLPLRVRMRCSLPCVRCACVLCCSAQPARHARRHRRHRVHHRSRGRTHWAARSRARVPASYVAPPSAAVSVVGTDPPCAAAPLPPLFLFRAGRKAEELRRGVLGPQVHVHRPDAVHPGGLPGVHPAGHPGHRHCQWRPGGDLAVFHAAREQRKAGVCGGGVPVTRLPRRLQRACGGPQPLVGWVCAL
jgi:hypothetical protein